MHKSSEIFYARGGRGSFHTAWAPPRRSDLGQLCPVTGDKRPRNAHLEPFAGWTQSGPSRPYHLVSSHSRSSRGLVLAIPMIPVLVALQSMCRGSHGGLVK